MGEYASHYLRSATVAGGYLYFISPGEPFTIQRVPLGGGAAAPFAEGVTSVFFAVSRNFAYYLRQPDSTLYAQPLDGGPPKAIGRLPEHEGMRGNMGISVAPNNAEIVWGAGARKQLDLFLVRGIS